MWFMLDDWSPSGRPSDLQGCYSGLRYVDGKKKPSWYAFARLATSLTLRCVALLDGRRDRITSTPRARQR